MKNWVINNKRLFEFLSVVFILLLFEVAFFYRFIAIESFIEPRYIVLTLASISIIPAIILFFKSSKVRFILEITYIFIQLVIFITNTTLFHFKQDLFSIGMIFDIGDGLKMGIKYNIFVAFKFWEWLIIFSIIIAIVFFLSYLTLKKNYQVKKIPIGYVFILICSFVILSISGALIKPLDKSIYNLPQDKRNFVFTFGVATYNQKDTINIITDLISQRYQKLSAYELLENVNEHNTPDSPVTGTLKDKNVIMIMMETVEEYCVDEKLTPTLHYLLNNGYVFENTYGVAKTNYTYDAEFKSLTSMMYYNADNFMYVYDENEFTNALPFVLRENGYSANSFHGYYKSYFNRDKMHQALGFERYYSYEDMEFSEVDFWPLDSEMFFQMKDKIAPLQDKPFYSFIITLSTHGSFAQRRTEFSEYYKLIDEDGRFSNHEEEFINLLAAQMDLDKGLEILIDYLKSKHLYNDTVILLFSDHKNYSSFEITEKYSNNIYTKYDYDKVPFTIFNPEIETRKIEYRTSQYDIMPTLLDLLGIKVCKDYYYGQSVFLNDNNLYENRPIIFGYNRWIDDNLIVYDKDILYPLEEEIDEQYYIELRNLIHQTIDKFHAFFMTDYFRKTTIE
ncbi:MAG TPA: sulfatase-like hydrolase/transferase [Acholeplasmataceae bacterium]|nr:sulfatase-like hydrolase/transferase [Acholeplasmataceae bacterium]